MKSASPYAPGHVAERRGRGDRRRRHPLLAHWRFAAAGRRHEFRRASDRRSASCVVDRFSPRLTAICLGIVVLGLCDAAFTLELISRGLVVEANPVMATALGGGIGVFLAAKLTITGVGVVVLAAYSRLELLGRMPLAGALEGLLAVYVGLVSYELTLLALYA